MNRMPAHMCRHMVPLLLAFTWFCSVAAEQLSDSSETQPSCLLQTGRQKNGPTALEGQRSYPHRSETVHEDVKEAQPQHISTLSELGVAFQRILGMSGKPNGDLDMDKTTMSQDNLPEDSRHINKETYTNDWSREYPPFVQEVLPQLKPVAGYWFMKPVEGWSFWSYWLLFLLLLVCLLMCCCWMALLLFRRRKREEHEAPDSYDQLLMRLATQHNPPQHYSRQAIRMDRPQYAPGPLGEQTYLPVGYDAARRPPAMPTMPTRHWTSTLPEPPPRVATVGVDSTGDGRANYVYAGIDRNQDGIPDALQNPNVPQQHVASVGVDSTGDGHANYVYKGVDRNNDGIPDALQQAHVHTATVAVDADGDGRADYIYTGIDRDNDGIPDAMERSNVHTATVAVDADGDARADYVYTGADRNNDGIPDALQSAQVYPPQVRTSQVRTSQVSQVRQGRGSMR